MNPAIDISLASQQPENGSVAGFVPVNVSMDGITVLLTNGCKAITFDVTQDQAFSINQGISGSVSLRPLTHDIMRDIIDVFGIQVAQLRIDRFEDDVYKARMSLRQGDRVLDIDMRPSDSIALAVRLEKTYYVAENIMNEKAADICH
jgi:bifunctional DNase/RNase